MEGHDRAGGKQVYIRNGNQSIEAPRDVMNNLCLRGANMTWDEVVTDIEADSLNFVNFERKLKERRFVVEDGVKRVRRRVERPRIPFIEELNAIGCFVSKM